MKNLTQKTENLFVAIIENERFDFQKLFKKNEQELFTDFALMNYGIEFRETKKCADEVKEVKIKNERKSSVIQFICKLEKLENIHSSMTDIRKKYGLKSGIFKAKIEMGKIISYNKNTFRLRLWKNRLHLLINGNKYYHWSLEEFSKRAGISLKDVKEYIKREKISIAFNIGISKGKPKDHGTIIRLYK